MPPELKRNKQLSEQSDIFSLGVTIIDIIAGLHGFYDLHDLEAPEFLDKVPKMLFAIGDHNIINHVVYCLYYQVEHNMLNQIDHDLVTSFTHKNK